MTTNLAGSAYRNSPTRWRGAVLAIISLVILGTATSPVLAGGWKGANDRGAGRERAASASAGPAQSIGLGGGRLLFGFGLLRDVIGNLARGGPGEGATPHVSPTTDWKGQVNTNICNFQHICQ